MKFNCFLFVILEFYLNYATAAKKVVMCYYGSWATYRTGRGKFDVGNINIDLCSHLVYTFAGINYEGRVVSLDPYLDVPDNYGRDNFRKFNNLKLKKPTLKTLLAVGGWNEGSSKYSQMAAIPALRKNFSDSTVNMLLKYGFDGLDLDWEYPNQRDTIHGEDDVINFTQLLKELRDTFDQYRLLLTAAVPSAKSIASQSYDIPAISQYLDIIAVMTYDMNLPTDGVTGHNSPLHKGEGDEDILKEDAQTVDISLDYWLNHGCPPEKMVMGLPFYAHTYTLSNINSNGVRAPAYEPGIVGPYTQTSGNIGYNELCELFKTQNWEKRYDELAKVPYAVQGRNWISYDDVNSIVIKIRYALDLGLAGVMVWSIETDDFRGYCGETYPLLQAVNTTLEVSTTTSVSNSTSTPGDVSSTTPNSTHLSSTEANLDTICAREGLIGNPNNCSSYYMCIRDVKGQLVPVEFQCPAGLYWDQDHLYCNYPTAVKCNI